MCGSPMDTNLTSTSSTIPTGRVTFLFTDIEESTKRWEEQPDAMARALQRHDNLLRSTIEDHGGFVFKTVGDAFCASFSNALHALSTALDLQLALHEDEWRSHKVGSVPIRVRMALHTGIPEEREGDYFGPPVNRVARLLSARHGGQVLVSLSTYELLQDHLPAGVELRDMGERRLKDLIRPEHVYQVVQPGLPSRFPALKTLDARPNNLPAQPAPLIGRKKELAALMDLLNRPEARLVTLTGPGGIGKTRLALQAGADMIDQFQDGTILVDLTPLADPSLVAATIARALGVTEVAGQPILQTLTSYLKDKQVLLLLDNFEQVIEASRDIAAIMSGSHRLKIVVTSREPLRIRGEQSFDVPPLSLPDLEQLPPANELAQYEQCESVRLFVERATAIRSDFALTDTNAGAVAKICHRLDGLPLAIELAAARIRILTPAEMLPRLQGSLKLLTGGARDLPPRQQALWSTIKWSYDLLDDGEKMLFRRLAVFNGGCTVHAAEAVCSSVTGLPEEVLVGLESLTSKSLLRSDEGEQNPSRIAMLSTIREYALQQLEESGEGTPARQAHAIYFAAMAVQGETELLGGRQLEWLKRLQADHDNLRAALDWSLEGDKGDRKGERLAIGFRLGGAVWRLWRLLGYFTEGRQRLDALLARSRELEADRPGIALQARVLTGSGVLTLQQGDVEAARDQLDESLGMYRLLGDSWNGGYVLNRLADLAYRQGDEATVHRLSEESLGIFDGLRDNWGMADALQGMASAASLRGDKEQWRKYSYRSLELFRQTGDKYSTNRALLNLGFMSSSQGDYEQARPLFEQSLDLARELGNKSVIAVTLLNLGVVASAQGDYEVAEKLHKETLALYRELGSKFGIAVTLYNLGLEACRRGDTSEGKTHFRESLHLLQMLKHNEGIALCLGGLAAIIRIEGNPKRAARLLGAASSLLEAIEARLHPADKDEYERNVAATREALTEDNWQLAWDSGRAMPIEEAIALSLEER